MQQDSISFYSALLLLFYTPRNSPLILAILGHSDLTNELKKYLSLWSFNLEREHCDTHIITMNLDRYGLHANLLKHLGGDMQDFLSDGGYTMKFLWHKKNAS